MDINIPGVRGESVDPVIGIPKWVCNGIGRPPPPDRIANLYYYFLVGCIATDSYCSVCVGGGSFVKRKCFLSSILGSKSETISMIVIQVKNIVNNVDRQGTRAGLRFGDLYFCISINFVI